MYKRQKHLNLMGRDLVYLAFFFTLAPLLPLFLLLFTPCLPLREILGNSVIQRHFQTTDENDEEQ